MVNTEIRVITFFAAKDREALYSQQKQEWELTVAQILNLLLTNSDLNWRRQGKHLLSEWKTIPEWYDLNQIPYDYTVEMTNRFKRLDLIECLKNYGRMFITMYRRQWSRPSPGKRNAKGKMVVWGGLTNSWEKKKSKRQMRKGMKYPFECRVPKNSKER